MRKFLTFADPSGLVRWHVQEDGPIEIWLHSPQLMKACGAKSPICGCVDYYADFDGTCKCENGKVSMDLVIEYNPKALYILKTWWGPRGLIRAHERGHLSDHMRVLNEQRVDGERLEADEYGSVPECEAKKNAWREAGFAKLKSAAFSQDKMTVKGRLCFPGLF